MVKGWGQDHGSRSNFWHAAFDISDLALLPPSHCSSLFYRTVSQDRLPPSLLSLLPSPSLPLTVLIPPSIIFQDCITQYLSQDCLNISSEYEVYEALIRWVQRNKSSRGKNYQLSYENPPLLGPLLPPHSHSSSLTINPSLYYFTGLYHPVFISGPPQHIIRI